MARWPAICWIERWGLQRWIIPDRRMSWNWRPERIAARLTTLERDVATITRQLRLLHAEHSELLAQGLLIHDD